MAVYSRRRRAEPTSGVGRFPASCAATGSRVSVARKVAADRQVERARIACPHRPFIALRRKLSALQSADCLLIDQSGFATLRPDPAHQHQHPRQLRSRRIA